MNQDKIKSLVDEYARNKGLKLSKLRDAIHAELENTKEVVVLEAGKSKD